MLNDLRHACRSFLNNPVFTIVVLLTLAFGIGANTAIFSVVDTVLLAPLSYQDPDALLRVRRGTSWPDMHDWIAQTESFASIGGFRAQLFDYGTSEGAERHDGAFVTGRLFATLGAQPVLGRLIADEDDRAGAPHVAVLTEAFWRSRLGGDPSIVGRSVAFNGMSYTIVGVVDRRFELPDAKADVFSPIAAETPDEANARSAHTMRAILRLKPGIAMAQAQAELDALAVRLEKAYPGTNRQMRFRLQRLDDSVVGGMRPALLILSATVAFVLLIACVNVANLLIARAAARRTELAIRAALGAGRGRILQQLLTESLALACAGGVLGLTIAFTLVKAVTALAPETLPRIDRVGLDARVLAFTGAVSLLTGVLFGVLPAWVASGASLVDATRSAGRATASRQRLRSALMAAEIALALILLVGAGLLLRSFARIADQRVGFETAHLLTGNITFSAARYRDIPTRTRFFQQLEAALRATPGVRGVGFTTALPIGGNPVFHNLTFEERQVDPGTEPEVYYRGVNADYFGTIGLPLLRGRAFGTTDTQTSPGVAIVNDAFVRAYYPGDDALGKRIRWTSGLPQWMSIVGVVPDVRGLALDADEVPAVYVPFPQEQNWWRMWMDVAVRTDGDPRLAAEATRRAVASIDRSVPIAHVQTMDEVIGASLAERRFNLFLLGGFAILSVLLAGAGTYGVMAYLVAQRSRELGVRLALGARPADVMRLVLGQGLSVAAAGAVAGLGGSLLTSRLLTGLLYGVGPTDVVTLTAAPSLLMTVAALACYVPAQRAASLDPLVVLRSE